MKAASLCRSIMQVPRCRIQSFLCHRSTFVYSYWSRAVCSGTLSCKSSSGFRLFESNHHHFEHPQAEANRIRSLLTRSVRDIARNAGSKLRHEFLDGTVKASTSSESALERFGSIKFSDAEKKILWGQNSKEDLDVFVFDLETTGLCRETGRIIEIAVRHLSGGKNSCFQSLVNPEQYVSNSEIHGITTSMVHHPHVPRLEDLTPIFMQYITSRQILGRDCLFVAHNARGFDVPFLINEFRRRSVDVPSNWLFLDTLPLARQLKRSYGLKHPSKTSLEGLRMHYEIPLLGSAHRAMVDVHLLTEILERLTSDLKLTTSDLLERAFKASDLITMEKNRKKS